MNQPNLICLNCAIACDFLAKGCRLSVRQVVALRPDLIFTGKTRQDQNRRKWAAINAPILAAKVEQQKATASLGFAKYDRRRKNAKAYWRVNREAKEGYARG